MFWWIVNKKCMRPVMFIFNLIVYAINIALISESVYMFLCIHAGLETDWYAIAMERMSEMDVFFSNQSQVIFQALIITFVSVCIFSLAITAGYRFIQLQSERNILGMYITMGYGGRQLFQQILLDVLSDVIICVPLAGIFYMYIQYFISQEPVFVHIQEGWDNWYANEMVVLIMSVMAVGIVLIVQSAIYIKRLKEKTPRSLINGEENYE